MFIVAIIITAIITYIVTYICVKHKFKKLVQDTEDKQQNIVLVDGSVGPSNQITTKEDLELQHNPAHGSIDKIIMDTNPAYETYK